MTDTNVSKEDEEKALQELHNELFGSTKESISSLDLPSWPKPFYIKGENGNFVLKELSEEEYNKLKGQQDK
jgi:hypothetical protein